MIILHSGCIGNCRDFQEGLALPDQLDHRAQLVLLDKLVHLAQQGPLELKDNQDLKEGKEIQDHWVQLDHQDQLVVMEKPEHLAEMVTKENRDKLAHKDQE